jgi:hypothetical protein
MLLIGIDDTDILGSTGTGRMARDLTDYLTGLGMGRSCGVTRHQLLVDERIPYTSHNSSLCIGFETELLPEAFYRPAAEFLKNNFREGSDPGLCICLSEDIPGAVIEFGIKAQREVLKKGTAIGMAVSTGIFLDELGGTGDGIIGSLAAVGLRAEGNSGRYIDLPGIRDINGTVTVTDLLERTDIEAVTNSSGISLNGDDVIDSRDWIRPSLFEGRPVLKARPRLSSLRDTAWTSMEIRERERRQLEELYGKL